MCVCVWAKQSFNQAQSGDHMNDPLLADEDVLLGVTPENLPGSVQAP